VIISFRFFSLTSALSRLAPASGQALPSEKEGTLLLSGSVGLPLDHDAAPRTATISLAPHPSSTAASHPWVFRSVVEEANRSSESLVLVDAKLRIPEHLRYRESIASKSLSESTAADAFTSHRRLLG